MEIQKIHFIFTRIIFQINLLHIFPIFPPNSFSIWVPLSWKVSFLLYGKIMLRNANKKASDFFVMETLGKIFQFLFFALWRRGGVIEITSGKWHVGKFWGRKNIRMSPSVSFQVSMILTKKERKIQSSHENLEPQIISISKKNKNRKRTQISFQGSDNVEFLKKVNFSDLLNFSEGSDFVNHKNDFSSVFE
jgi:hypothetical protein